MNSSRTAVFFAIALIPRARGQDSSHEEHLKQTSGDAEMKKRGDVAMGFYQEKVSHRFRLSSTGGIIEVRAIHNGDAQTRQQIRNHLRTIAQEFAEGVFASPIATHAEVPPGVPLMRERKAQITYSYKKTADGAEVVINTV